MNEDIERRREIVARYLRESASAEHSGPEMVKMGLVAKAKARDDGKLEIALSTEDLDRHGDILRSSGAVLTAFKKNPVLLFAHMHSRPAVGKVSGLKKGQRDKDGVGEITGLVEFAPTPLGEELKLLYEGGFMKAFSVGFIPIKWDRMKDEDGEPDPDYGLDVKKWELLEVSAVPVPANPAALSRCDMSALKGGTEEEVVVAIKAFREAAEEESVADPIALSQACTFCDEPSFHGSPGLCTYHASLLEREMAEPADDIRESFEEALLELRAKIADGTWEIETFDWGEEEDDQSFIGVDEDGAAIVTLGVNPGLGFHTLAEAAEAFEDAFVVFEDNAIEAPSEPEPEPKPEDDPEDEDDPEPDDDDTDDEPIERIYDMKEAMEELKEASEATLAVLEKILAVKAAIDPEPEPKPEEPAAPEEPEEPEDEDDPEDEPEKGLTRDEALDMMKGALKDIGEEIKETTAKTIRAEMGRAVDIP